MLKNLPLDFIIKIAILTGLSLLQSGCQTRPKDPGQSSTALPAQQPGDPWFAAARTGNWEQFEKLQASLNRPWDFKGPNGVSAMMVAARNGQIQFVENLLKKKVSVNALDVYSYNALSYALHGASKTPAKKQLCLILVENGADAFNEDHLKLSPILVMIEEGFEECIKEVKFSDFKPCDQQNRLSEVTSLVTYAEKEEEFKIRDFLKEKGCN